MRARWRRIAVRGVVASVAVAGAVPLVAACITPPPEWSDPPPERPTILHDQSVPPENQLLQTPPTQSTTVNFTVNVSVEVPTLGFSYAAFIDYDPNANPQPPPQIHGTYPTTSSHVTPVPFPLTLDSTCHRIDFVVAHGYATVGGVTQYHVPDSIGGDVSYWFSFPGGSPNGCPGYDAGIYGIYQDGASPPSDAAVEAAQ